jgi:putative disulphide-isomerase
MKKFVLLFTGMLMMVSVFAQTNFQELTLEKALEKAKGENKKVFVDCYTSWCGPCKMMAEKVLPLKEVGEYMNERFVCIKVDMEKGEGPDLARKYKVTAYPTFLVLKADGSLMQRVVGGTLDGKEFIQKVDAAFDENSAANLEAEYAAGNRKMDFLLQYTKALVTACDLDKAKAVAQDIIGSLEDCQKCTEPYWFIYEDVSLSPIGSGNMTYFLKHTDQFREGVGVEKVDKKLASLFDLQLEEMIRGRNAAATLADVEAVQKTLDAYKLTGQDYLYEYIELIKGMKTGNTDKVLEMCKKVFPKMADEKIAYLYFMPILSLKGKWNGKQKEELETLTEQLAEQVEMSTLKASLRNFKTAVARL